MVEIYPRPIIEHYLTSYSSMHREGKVVMKSYLNLQIPFQSFTYRKGIHTSQNDMLIKERNRQPMFKKI
jgi:hypothetical protein